jgi:creatinine amidohydrolase
VSAGERPTLLELAASPFTSVEEARASGKRLVAFLPVGATEAHGPHLPLATDVIIAHELAVRSALLVAARGDLAPCMLPAIAYASAEYARPFAGTISISKETLRALVVDIARALGEQGFSGLVVVNGHLEPDHVRNLRAAAEEVRAKAPGLEFVLAPEWTSARYRPHLPAEFFEGGAHAGAYETSLVLAAEPGLVDEYARTGLPPVKRDLARAMKEGAKTFREIAGGERAYFGDPSSASAAIGNRVFDALARELTAEIGEASGA